jgi:hypothetical protein
VRQLFISYARQNKPDVEQLVEHLRVLGCDTWHDSSLHGGQDWWEEILGRIAACDTFAIISREALNSTAFRRELDSAEALDKPVLPVTVEFLPRDVPRFSSMREIVDYSEAENRDKAALTLAGALATAPAATVGPVRRDCPAGSHATACVPSPSEPSKLPIVNHPALLATRAVAQATR